MTLEDVEAAVARARKLAAVPGAPQGAGLQQAADLVRGLGPDLPERVRPMAARILWRAGFYEEADAIGDLATLGRISVETDQPAGLLFQFPKVRTDADRATLLDLHRLWGERLTARAAERPLPPRASAPGERLRLGVLSSDLRQHVVGHLIHPLFRWRDPRFELFVYIAGGQASDVAQDWFAAQSTRFVRLPAGDRAAAEIIAADDLDLLLDVGGPTSSNQPGVLAWKPARRQVSWLGYPHPLGVPTVDAILLDAPLTPQRRELLAEPALILPHTWLSMSPAAFQAEPTLRPELPMARRGFVTFATANDPYKFSPELLRTWARIVAAVPNARFRLIRYEAAAPALQRNIARHFAAEGVGLEQLEFPAIAGNARALYDDVDIALDTFPMAGGMTTCEALWMGVPTVTLAGSQVFERLGASILMAAGLPGLVTATVAEYERTALRLAAEIEGLTELRRTLRARLAAQPIGQPERFAADFYATIARACD